MNISNKLKISTILITSIIAISSLTGISSEIKKNIQGVLDPSIKIRVNDIEQSLNNVVDENLSTVIINGRTYLPLRSIANIFNFNIDWDDNTRTVKIKSNVNKRTNLSKVTMPDILPEMNSANFWINRMDNPHKIIMTKKQIDSYNNRMSVIEQTKVYDLKKHRNFLTEEELKNYIAELPIPTEERYIGNTLVDDNYYEPIIKNMNIAKINKTNQVSYALVVKRTDLRTLPTKDPSYGEPNDFEFDYFQETALEVADPVIVLHKSLDNLWYFIQTYNYRGWVSAHDIAISTTKNEWSQYIDNDNFIVVTANSISLPKNPYSPYLSGIRVGMGCKLPIWSSENQPEYVDSMLSAGNIVAIFPIRNTEGMLEFKNVLLPQTSDISLGYLDFTRANILNQAFKSLGDRYGWGGLWESRDCSSFICDIYKCFGIKLPRNTTEQEFSYGKDIKFTNEDYNIRSEIFTSSVKPGAGVYMKYHVMLYLGEFNGKHHVIHSTYSYYDKNKPKPDGGYERVFPNSVIVSNLDLYKNDKTFLENLTIVKNFY